VLTLRNERDVGIAFGLGVSGVATRLMGLPLLDILLVAVGFSGAIGVGFGIFFPARQAARLRPIDALRHE